MTPHRAIVSHGMSSETLNAIGDFVVSFSNMEYAIKLGIQTLLSCSVPHKGVITAHQNVSHLIKMLRELYRKADEQRVSFETIDELCNEAQGIGTFRNNLMHSNLTAINEETIELEKRKNNNQFELRVQNLDISELKNMTKKTQHVAGDLICIWMGYHTITPHVT